MNDFSEIEHGLRLIRMMYSGSVGVAFRELMDEISPGLSKDFATHFDNVQESLRNHTFITSISEHDDKEDAHGRLSMWRAYGGKASVALVMNQAVFVNPSDALRAFTMPVLYLSDEDAEDLFANIYNCLHKQKATIKSMGRNSILMNLLNFFILFAASSKHPGFAEEKEWRVIHTPSFGVSENLQREIVSINGVSQLILKVPLKSIPQQGLIGLDPSELLDRLIIGPSQYPTALHEAFSAALNGIGIQSATSKFFISGIPLRT